jgi:hypothetical protein
MKRLIMPGARRSWILENLLVVQLKNPFRTIDGPEARKTPVVSFENGMTGFP